MTGIVCSMVGASFAVAVTGDRVAKTMTVSGNAQIDTAQSVFGGSALLFDGTTDYITVAANNDFSFGTGDFTIEFRIRFAAVDALYVPICQRASTGIANGEWWCEVTAAEDEMYWGFKNTAGTQYYVNLSLSGTAFAINTWYHIALVRNGSSLQLYQAGTATGSATTVTGSFGGNASLFIGALGNGSYSLNGWMDEIRISNTARYTANFTPSTSPFVNDANTILLIHGDADDATTTILDDNNSGSGRSRITWTAQGNAQLDTAQYKFGTASLLLDGNGDYINTGVNSSLTLGTSDHTIEAWVRLDSSANNRNTIFSNGVTSFTTNWMKLGVDLSGGSYYLQFIAYDYSSGGTPAITSSVALSTATWYHVALVRSATEWFMYIDGTQRGSNITATAKGITANWNANSISQIGRYSFDNGANPASTYFDGWIDSIRISKTARYTANFTAPTAEFTNDKNTLVLLKFDGADAATTITDDNS